LIGKELIIHDSKINNYLLSQSVTPNSIPIRDVSGYLKDLGRINEITTRTSNTLILPPDSQVPTYRINVGECYKIIVPLTNIRYIELPFITSNTDIYSLTISHITSTQTTSTYTGTQLLLLPTYSTLTNGR
jgi:hypothetical protein